MTRLSLLIVYLAAAWSSCLSAAPPPTGSKGSSKAIERKAGRMIEKAVDLLQMGHEERGVKMISQVPRMYPEASARFRAYLMLGAHLTSKRAFDQAIKSFKPVLASESPEEQAEALYRIGICHYSMNDFGKAFMSLRRVTNEFPESVFANESFYYIGLCHFKQKRWNKSVEALRMVGTRVPEVDTEVRYVEAGQRLFAKVEDEDLVVLLRGQGSLTVEAVVASGDKEKLVLKVLGRKGKTFVGSIPSQPGKAIPGDGTLQVLGGDEITITYLDENTEDDKRNQATVTKLKVVSTGVLNFIDGAFREVVSVVPTAQPAHVQVRDLDLDTSDAPDQVSITVTAHYKVREEDREVDIDRRGVDLDRKEVEWIERSRIALQLKETGSHTGIFRGTFMPHQPESVDGQDAVRQTVAASGQAVLKVMKRDRVTMTYVDTRHIAGEEERDVVATAPVVVGQFADVKSPVYDVDDPAMKARKLLIEGQIFLEWGKIFKDVGLIAKAVEKGDEGLDRVEQLMTTYARLGFDRDLVEEAFKVKWELLLLQDKLPQAIATCRQLTAIFPDTLLADDAFLKIGQARMLNEDYEEAIRVFKHVMALPSADVKAEAQYSIGVSLEKMAIARAAEANAAGRGGGQPQLAPAMLAYKRCADLFPESPFAGESLQKMITYYVLNRDYARATDAVRLIMQDYQDAPWLDTVLLKGAIAAYRAENYSLAHEWFQTIVEEYSESKSAAKAQELMGVVERKLGSGAEG